MSGMKDHVMELVEAEAAKILDRMTGGKRPATVEEQRRAFDAAMVLVMFGKEG